MMDIRLKTRPIEISESDKKSLPEEEKIIVCARCLFPVTDPSKQITVKGSFSHIFANPHGHVFEIGCFSDADGCISASPKSDEFSWFSGCEWQIGICKNCAVHLGWIFTSRDERFYGLILEKIIFP